MNYTKILDQELLMVYAQDPADSLTKAFAGMILSTTRAGIFPPVGVSDADFIELLGATSQAHGKCYLRILPVLNLGRRFPAQRYQRPEMGARMVTWPE